MGFSTTNTLLRPSLRSCWFQCRPNIEVSVIVSVTYATTLPVQTRISIRTPKSVNCQRCRRVFLFTSGSHQISLSATDLPWCNEKYFIRATSKCEVKSADVTSRALGSPRHYSTSAKSLWQITKVSVIALVLIDCYVIPYRGWTTGV